MTTPRTNADNGYTDWVVEYVGAHGYPVRKSLRTEVAYRKFIDKCLDVYGYKILATSSPDDVI